jgi:mono/diheme cytochrome c family protein
MNGQRLRLGGVVYWTTLTLAVGFCVSVLGATSVAQGTGDLDPELGKRLFTERGCVSCHTLGEGRLVGPDLQRVTKRRSDTWTVAMITSPDSMLRTDSTARALLQAYVTPMPDLNVRPYEARALVAYLRAQSEGLAAAESTPADVSGRPMGYASSHRGQHHGSGMWRGEARGKGSRNARRPHERARHHGAQSTPN